MTQQIRWLVVGMVLIAASVVQARGMEIITPPLRNGTSCFVTNVSDAPVDVDAEILDAQGLFLNGAANPALPSLWTMSFSGSTSAVAGIVCRVLSDAAKKGDLKVTFCATVAGEPGCQGLVTAE